MFILLHAPNHITAAFSGEWIAGGPSYLWLPHLWLSPTADPKSPGEGKETAPAPVCKVQMFFSGFDSSKRCCVAISQIVLAVMGHPERILGLQEPVWKCQASLCYFKKGTWVLIPMGSSGTFSDRCRDMVVPFFVTPEFTVFGSLQVRFALGLGGWILSNQDRIEGMSWDAGA